MIRHARCEHCGHRQVDVVWRQGYDVPLCDECCRVLFPKRLDEATTEARAFVELNLKSPHAAFYKYGSKLADIIAALLAERDAQAAPTTKE